MKQTNFLELLRRIFGCTDAFVIVRQLVSDVLAAVNPDGPPFDPRAVANHFGVAVVDCNIPNEGFLTTGRLLTDHLSQFHDVVRTDKSCDVSSDQPVIVVRTLPAQRLAAARRKQRFTVAHEFGHWYLRDRLTERSGERLTFGHGDPDEEMLCNLFAAELLMPTDLFLKDLATTDFDLTTLVALTGLYDVSLAHLLVKTTALSRHYAAFALFGQRSNSLEIHFSTPYRQQEVFFDCKLRADVSQVLLDQEERRATYVVSIRGKRKEVEARHLPIEDNRTVLSFLHDHPFETRELCAEATA